MASTKQAKHNNPDLTRRAALTTPPGALLPCLGRHRREALPLKLLTVTAACSLLLAFLALTARPTVALESNADGGFTLRKMKLIAPGSGWVLLDRQASSPSTEEPEVEYKLQITNNGGKSWQDITPHDDRARILSDIFFLDTRHGWVVGANTERADSLRYYLFVTSDGGKTWQVSALQTVLLNPSEPMFERTLLFVDPLHGWMTWRWAAMNSRVNALLATTDGGKTWNRLPDPPSPGPLHFISPKVGWMIGASEGQEGIPVTEDDALWVTHDGGKKWEPVAIHIPTDFPDEGTFLSDVKFKNRKQGTVAATIQGTQGGVSIQSVECTTSDGGKTWKFVKFDSSATPVIAGDFLYWSVFDWKSKKATLRTTAAEIDSQLPGELSPEGHLGVFDFTNKQDGWATFNNAPLATPGLGYAQLELLSTADGGRTWQLITPPEAAASAFPQPELFSVNGIVARFPRVPTNFAIRYQPPLAGRGLMPFNRSIPGGPMELRGRGFLRENTVRIGEESLKAESKDGSSIRISVPDKLQPGYYELSVENAHGKTDSVSIAIGSPACLQVTSVQGLTVRCGCRPVIHPGQTIRIEGMGFKQGDAAKLRGETLLPKLVMENGLALEIEIPASLSKGPAQLYILSETQASNVVGIEVQ